MKLISMTDFVLEAKENGGYTYNSNQLRYYAELLKQPLTLGMFVPCDEDGNSLEEPKESNYNLGDIHAGYYRKDLTKYQQAKERVLFEGFEIHNRHNVINRGLGIVIVFSGIISILIDGNNGLGGFSKNDATIEDLVILYLTLTETAIKQIGL